MHFDNLDDYDNRILEVIRDHARLSYSEIGEAVGLSRVSVHKRMDHLEQMGVIEGYYTRINSLAEPEGRQFLVVVNFEPTASAKVMEELASIDEVRKIRRTTGAGQIWAEGMAATQGTYEACMRRLRKLERKEGVTQVLIQDVQYTVKDADKGIDYVQDECEGTGDR